MILQTALFFSTIALLIFIMNDLHRGWSILNDLNKNADFSVNTLVQGNYKTINEQIAILDELVVPNSRFINSTDQITIEWYNSGGTLINSSDAGNPSAELALYTDACPQAMTEAECDASITSKVKVTIIYPVTMPNPFPSAALKTFIGEKELNATSEKTYALQARAKDFRLRVRTLDSDLGIDEYRPICATHFFSNKREFWDIMCQKAAALSDYSLADKYQAIGLDSSAAISMEEGINILSSLYVNIVGDALAKSSVIESWDYNSMEFKFSRLDSLADCNNRAPGLTAHFVLADLICSPEGFNPELAANDLRYIILENNASGVANINAYLDEISAACPNSDCCTGSCS